MIGSMASTKNHFDFGQPSSYLSSMKRILITAVLSLSLVACGPEPVQRSHAHAIKAEKVKHLSDGRYAYQDDTGIWWWFYVSQMQGSSAGYYTGPASGLTSAGVSAGKGSQPSESELEGSTETEVELDVMAEGEPAIETTTEGETSVSEATPASSSETSSSSSSDSGSSGGGDSGGGGGE